MFRDLASSSATKRQTRIKWTEEQDKVMIRAMIIGDSTPFKYDICAVKLNEENNDMFPSENLNRETRPFGAGNRGSPIRFMETRISIWV